MAMRVGQYLQCQSLADHRLLGTSSFHPFFIKFLNNPFSLESNAQRLEIKRFY